MVLSDTGYLLIGIVISGFLGLAFGNFATNPIYRLPRRELIFLKDPYCGECNAKLQPIDLFPVLSWLMTKGKCRYCGASFPADYAIIEALIGVLFILCYFKWGFTEQFLLAAFGMTTLVMIAAMQHLDNFFSGKTAIAAIVLGALFHTLNEHTLYNMAGGAFTGLIVGGIAWRMSGKEMIRDIVAFPPYMDLLVVAGVWLPLPQFFGVCLVAGVVHLLGKGKPWWVEWAIIGATLMGMLVFLK